MLVRRGKTETRAVRAIDAPADLRIAHPSAHRLDVAFGETKPAADRGFVDDCQHLVRIVAAPAQLQKTYESRHQRALALGAAVGNVEGYARLRRREHRFY